jgi:hypothetical protein
MPASLIELNDGINTMATSNKVPDDFKNKSDFESIKNTKGDGILTRLKDAVDFGASVSAIVESNNFGAAACIYLQFGCIIAAMMCEGIAVGDTSTKHNAEKINVTERYTKDDNITYQNIEDEFRKLPYMYLRKRFGAKVFDKSTEANRKAVIILLLEVLKRIEYIPRVYAACINAKRALSVGTVGTNTAVHLNDMRLIPEALISQIYDSGNFVASKTNLLTLMGMIVFSSNSKKGNGQESFFGDVVRKSCRREIARMMVRLDMTQMPKFSKNNIFDQTFGDFLNLGPTDENPVNTFKKKWVDVFAYVSFDEPEVKGSYKATPFEVMSLITDSLAYWKEAIRQEVNIIRNGAIPLSKNKMLDDLPKVTTFYYEACLIAICHIHTFMSTGMTSFNLGVTQLLDGSVLSQGMPANLKAIRSYLIFAAMKIWMAVMAPVYEKTILHVCANIK